METIPRASKQTHHFEKKANGQPLCLHVGALCGQLITPGDVNTPLKILLIHKSSMILPV